MKTELVLAFKEIFHQDPQVLVQAPTRVNIIGEHTDYNGGMVLPAAISHYLNFAVAKTTSDFAYIFDANSKKSVAVEIDRLLDLKQLSQWQKYYYGAIKLLSEQYEIGGFQMLKTGKVPFGAGISSSAALCCGIIFSVSELYNLEISLNEIALMAQQVEHDYVGINCGIMDQMAILHGETNKLIELDCSNLNFKKHEIDLGAYSFLLCNSMVKHNLVNTAYNERVEEVELALSFLKDQGQFYQYASQIDSSALSKIKDEKLYRRVLHILEENARVAQMLDALKALEYEKAGKLLNESHESLKVNYEVTCKETDYLKAKLVEFGALGARQMGGGFGGCMILLIENPKIEALKQKVLRAYSERYNKVAEFYELSFVDGVKRL